MELDTLLCLRQRIRTLKEIEEVLRDKLREFGVKPSKRMPIEFCAQAILSCTHCCDDIWLHKHTFYLAENLIATISFYMGENCLVVLERPRTQVIEDAFLFPYAPLE